MSIVSGLNLISAYIMLYAYEGALYSWNKHGVITKVLSPANIS